MTGRFFAREWLRYTAMSAHTLDVLVAFSVACLLAAQLALVTAAVVSLVSVATRGVEHYPTGVSVFVWASVALFAASMSIAAVIAPRLEADAVVDALARGGEHT